MKTKPIVFAILAAALYALNAPFSKLLLNGVGASMMAAFLYLGAGIGLFCVRTVSHRCRQDMPRHVPFTKKELPYLIGMIVLDIAAPILLMLGLRTTDAAAAALLNNFEIVATSLIALCIFRERISRLTWSAIVLVTLASVILGFSGAASAVSGLCFDPGALFILSACFCWGFENNCTRMLSARDTMEITTVKGLGSGTGALLVALLAGEALPALPQATAILILGFFAYGLSINFYILAQRDLGAAKTSAFYSVAPFLGVLFSFVLLGESPAPGFYIGCVLMALATVLLTKDSLDTSC